jgi:hypothetical protein
VLIDVSVTGPQAGLCWLLALTAPAWARCVAVPPGIACQVEAGRLWDLARMLLLAIGWGDGGREVRFGIHVRNDNVRRVAV